MSKAAGYDSLWMGNQFTVILNKPEDIQIALNSDKCFEKSSVYKLAHNYGLLSEGGEKYKDQRKSLKPLFSIQNLKNQIPMINEKFKYFMDSYENHIEGTKFEMRNLSSKFTLNTIVLTMFGYDHTNLFDDEMVKVMKGTDAYLKLSAERVFNPFLHSDLIYKLSQKQNEKVEVLKATLEVFTKNFSNKKLQQPSYFELMEPHTVKMDQEEFLESTAFFLGASFETTTVAISSIIFFLASNPDKQNKLFDEVSSVLSSHEDEVTESMMNEMSYLDLVIKESLRLIPIGVLMGRAAADDVEFSKCKLNYLT
jgi:cytochrome P450 family 4